MLWRNVDVVVRGVVVIQCMDSSIAATPLSVAVECEGQVLLVGCSWVTHQETFSIYIDVEIADAVLSRKRAQCKHQKR